MANEINAIEDIIRSYGVTVLEGDSKIIQTGKQKIRLCDIDDPDGFRSAYHTDRDAAESWQEQFDTCKAQTGDDIYSILMSHHPELVEEYQSRWPQLGEYSTTFSASALRPFASSR
ncbi:hypothetical protein OBV_38230 [Oscillibacter valericigenes Sjm18-20]|nr:hypothetical protein OBV_38230 [Oscillibacter valericigenes Sjm18-20]